MNKHFLFLCLTVLLFGAGAEFAFAQIALPWSTTYNCPESDQAGWFGSAPLNCDGLSRFGSWTANGQGEQITSAANYPGGAGGRGQRQWNCDGRNCNSGGTSLNFGSPQRELWMRWYMRYEQGYQWNPLGYDKILYFCPHDSTCFLVPGFYNGSLNMWVGSDRNYTSTVSAGTWNDIMKNGALDANGNRMSDGQWHVYEIHIKANTNGNDGVAQFWVDGNLVLDRQNVNMMTATGWSNVTIGENQNNPNNGRVMYVDYDDIAISTTGYIGPIGGIAPTPPPSDTTAPVISAIAASNLTTSSATISWTTNEAADGQVEFGTTACPCPFTSPVVSTLTATHTINLSGLNAGTTYYYRVRSRDAAGNLATSTLQTFMTQQQAVAPPPPPPAPSPTPSPSFAPTILLEERFEDNNFSARGWYDAPGGTLSTIEHIANSTASFECRFMAGATGCAGGAPRRHTFTPTSEVYLRYWVKYSANYTGSDRTYHPHEFYLLTTENTAYSGLAYTRLTAYVEQNEGVPLVAIQDGQNIDETRVGQDLTQITENRSVAGCNGTYPDGYSTISCYQAGTVHWNGKDWRAPQIYFGNTPGSATYKGDWHKVEAYFKLNSIQNGQGAQDGIVRYWFDDTLVIDRQNVVMRTAAYPNMQFNQLVIAPYIGDTSPVDQSFWIDELQVATARPTTSETPLSTPPPSDTTAPVISAIAASNLTTSSATISWTTNEAADGQVEFGTTACPCPFTSPVVSTLTATHTINLSGLNAGTTYYYRVRSRDAAGNLAVSQTQSFSTQAATTVTPPPSPSPSPSPSPAPSGAFPLISTTYNCPEQDQGTLGWLSGCDAGISKYGNWTTSLGSREQITSAANYPGGGGGRGQRHWIGNGLNNNSGGLRYTLPNPMNEVYVRWYVRWQQGLALGSAHKVLYFAGTGCGNPGGCYFDFFQGSLGTIVAGTPYRTNSYGWNAMNGGTNVSDGAWRCMEIHVKSETSSGAGNGIAEWWIDDVLRHRFTNVSYNNVNSTVPYFNFFVLPENANVITVNGQDMYNDIDDVVVSSSRIGCLASATSTPTAPTPPPSDTTAPAISAIAASNLTTSSATISWTTNEAADGQVEFDISPCPCPLASPLVSTLTTAHTINLSGLNAGTTYYYRVRSRDAAGNLATSALQTFMTQQQAVAPPPPPPPSPTSIIPRDVTPPVVSLTTPASHTALSGTVALTASASDASGISRVLFWHESLLLGTATTSPYGIAWNTRTVINGAHTLTAQAYDSAGNRATSAEVSVTVNNDTTPPSIMLISPRSRAIVNGAVAVIASASDNTGIARVEFFKDADTVPFAVDSAAPFETVWDTRNASAGAHSLYAQAFDAAGNARASYRVTITVDNAAPTIASFTLPYLSSTATSTSGRVTFAVSAADNIGYPRVEFYRDNDVLIGIDTYPAYAFVWNSFTAANGTHTFYAKAIDRAGNETRSPSITFAVANTPDTVPPRMSMGAPSQNARVRGTVTVSGSASDDKGVSLVAFYKDADTMPFATDTLAPFSVQLDTAAISDGAHTLTARVYDGAGNTATSSARAIMVDNTPPAVSLAASSAAIASAGTTILAATALDPSGVSRVEFYRNNTRIYTDYYAPYSYAFYGSALPQGTYTFFVKAYDKLGNSASSASLQLTR